MINMKETINHYLAAWNEKTATAVKAAFQKCCTPDVTYTDRNAPTYTEEGGFVIKGIDLLTALVMGSHAKVPGRAFSLLTMPQYFDGHCHYSWGLHIPGQDEKAGWDYIVYNEQNLITRIVGFLPEQV
ncbi:hypothetical protein BDD43_0866 [Mucilaginibacter gracilis]|uniref:SnoaL-like protein n=1 Tax=Mucilaginibacter gracilis TaxID=423350 RepID=A0A495IXF5_9SPHI|nr:hypothetical protein [Mucilaginibacter gracilis]RKR80734.1 hypothetical protein BDD43_0866 [Mucilaginibacter gracilis]